MTYDELKTEFLRRVNLLKLTDMTALNHKCAEILGKIISENVFEIDDISGACKKILHEYYEIMNETNALLQKKLDEKIGLQIAAQKADFPAERVAKVAKALTDPTVPPETIQRRARNAVENVANSFHDDYVRENAKFRSKAGIKCYIVRETDGNCCKWCTSLAGRFVYGEEPAEIFYHHDKCSCTVILENGRERQDVYSKKKWQVTPILKIPYEPLVFNKNQAQTLQNIQLAKYKNLGNGLTFNENGGTITLNEICDFKENMKKLGFENITGFENFQGNSSVLNELYNDFSKIKAVFPNHFNNISINFGNQEIGEETYAGYNTVTGVFHFNPSIYNSFSKLEQFYKSDVLSKYHPQGTTYRATVFHEFGHHIEKIANINNKKLVKSLYNKFNNGYFNRKLGDEWIKNNLSYYAAEGDYGELVSEAFAEYFESSEPRFLCIEIINEVMKNLS